MPSRVVFCDSIGYSAYKIKVIDSTNTYLKNNYELYENKSLLIANKQLNGRGRFDRVWKSDDDICFSILYKEKALYTIITPLAILYALKDLDIEAKIKWPNDIYINEKKLSGILIEEIYKDSFKASIVGIGVNMNDYDDYNAIGLSTIAFVSKDDFIVSILKYIEYFKLISNNKLIEMYKDNNLILNRRIYYNNKSYYAYDITNEGYLVLKNGSDIITVSSNEISISKNK